MEDSLVGRRSKRSTAGNRMEAALAEMNIDDLMQDVEDDVDFVSKVDEEDMFESDFASTDEEGQGDEEAGEKALEEEAKRAKRAARHKSFKTPKAPVRKVTFGSPAPVGDGATPSSAKAKAKQQRRVSLGQAVDAETGEVLESGKRQSTREATRLNTRELQSRLKNAEGRRASIAKRPREVERRRTQAELITAALDMEEDNVKSHRDYLKNEEERRKKARVVKPSTVGPKVRWRSRMEEVTVTTLDPASQHPYQVYRPSWSSPYAPNATPGQSPQTNASRPNSSSVPPPGSPSGSGSQPQQPPPAPQHPFTYVAAKPHSPSTSSSTATTASTSKQPATPGAPTTSQHFANHYYPYSYYSPQAQPPHSQYQPYGPYYAYQPQQNPYTPGQPPRSHLQLHPQTPAPRKTTEKQAKNYVELLVNEEQPRERPGWRETMDALFGKHVDWDNVKVYIGKNRPTTRPIQTCPITGLQARYRDPRSGVPYANAGAFRILSRLLAHEYLWSPAGAPGAVGVFIGHEKQRGAVGVPTAWGEAMAGVDEGWRKKRVERRREKAKEKEKEVRAGERRSSRIAGEGSEMGDKEPERMDVDQSVQGQQGKEDEPDSNVHATSHHPVIETV